MLLRLLIGLQYQFGEFSNLGLGRPKRPSAVTRFLALISRSQTLSCLIEQALQSMVAFPAAHL